MRSETGRNNQVSQNITQGLTACQGDAQVNKYVGRWMMLLNGSMFISLTMFEIDGCISGAMTRPEYFSTTNGSYFFDISDNSVTYLIIDGVIRGEHLYVTFGSSSGGEQSTYVMYCHAANLLKIKQVGSPFNAWLFRRQSGVESREISSQWSSIRAYVEGESGAECEELNKLYCSDQQARSQESTDGETANLAHDDRLRRNAALQLIISGRLHTGSDFQKAALIFQHGTEDADYLLAHTMAMIALTKGCPGASLIAAATLDRYLMFMGKQQIYGTQSCGCDDQEMLTRDVVPRILRRELGLPTHER
jgi:hypothetical protein